MEVSMINKYDIEFKKKIVRFFLEEAKKENEFKKKQRHSLRRKSIGLSFHSKIEIRWLLRRLNIYPNAYYNYLKNRKKKSTNQ